jgi:hypothetical protein
MVFLPLVTVSVNQAKVVPASIATHSVRLTTLVMNAVLVRRDCHRVGGVGVLISHPP